MPEKVSGRFTPMWDEFIGAVKVFVLFWIISFVVLFFATGADRWAFWGAAGIGFIVALIITIIIAVFTGVSNFQFPNVRKRKK